MKKAIAIIVAMLFVFAIASLAIAAEEKKAAPAPVEKKAEPAEKKVEKKAEKKQVTGEIKAIDKEKKTVTITKKVKDKVMETVVAVDDKTKIMEGKEKKALADLKVGDKVTAKFEDKEGKKTANSILIHKAEKKVEKKEMKKEEKKAAEPTKPAEKK